MEKTTATGGLKKAALQNSQPSKSLILSCSKFSTKTTHCHTLHCGQDVKTVLEIMDKVSIFVQIIAIIHVHQHVGSLFHSSRNRHCNPAEGHWYAAEGESQAQSTAEAVHPSLYIRRVRVILPTQKIRGLVQELPFLWLTAAKDTGCTSVNTPLAASYGNVPVPPPVM